MLIKLYLKNKAKIFLKIFKKNMFHFIYHIILEVRFILKISKNEIQRYLKIKIII